MSLINLVKVSEISHKDKTIMQFQKDTQTNQDKKNIATNSYFDVRNDAYISPVLKKLEKVVTALYMVSDCMDESEPMKIALRTLGVNLISSIHSIGLDKPITKNFSLATIETDLGKALSFVDIASTVGLISTMNGGILKNELEKLQNMISQIIDSNANSGFKNTNFEARALSTFALKEFLTTDEPAFPAAPMNTMIFKGHDIKDTKVMSFTKMSNKLDSAQTKKTTPSSSDMAIKMMRRSNILKIIKDKNEVTIKDISTIIKDCSEKTLQRELSGLVLENVLKKEGNKRWSKYSFK
jgi:hypothetical protein